jgi:hypothetical protein
MSVNTSTRKQSYAGGKNTNTFTFTALPSAPTDIKVLKTLISTGVETALAYTTDYSVAVSADGIGGVVTFVASVSTLYTTTVYRETTDLQTSDYDDYNQFPADTLERDLDIRTMISQERSEEVNRTAKVPISATITDVVLPIPVDANLLSWSGTGGTIANTPITAFTGSTGAIGPQGPAGAAGVIQAITAGTNVIVDATNPAYPIISSSLTKATGAEIDAGTNDDKFATAKAIADSGLLFTSFVDRGDPSAVDFAHGALTINGAYHNLDLSSIVPAGAKAVLIRLTLANATSGVYFRMRENGNSNTFNNFGYVIPTSSGPGQSVSAVVACDTDRVIEYAIENSGSWSIGLTVGGWWL